MLLTAMQNNVSRRAFKVTCMQMLIIIDRFFFKAVSSSILLHFVRAAVKTLENINEMAILASKHFLVTITNLL